ncbi:hypothetical protein BH11BAC7_BH11BAC7_22720 [soil metagenome]
MKKIVLACVFSMAAFSLWAQTEATVEIKTLEQVDPGKAIEVNGIYTPASGDTRPPAFHTWTITPCTEAGEVTDEILYSETIEGAPGSDFEFPGSEEYQRGQFYRIDIYVANDRGELAVAKGTVVEADNGNSTGVTGSTSITVAPGVAPTGTMHRLYLGTNAYYYTLTHTGGDFVTAFGVIVNGNGVNPLITFQFTGPDESLDFSFTVASNVTPCQSETFRITFFNTIIGEVSHFDYTINCKTDSKQTVVYMGNDLYYKGDDNHIHKMSVSGGGWNYQAITPLGGWGNIEVDGWLCGNPASNRIYFKSRDGKIYSMDDNGGNNYTLSQVSTVYDVKSDLQLRGNTQLIYIATNNTVHTLTYNGGWAPFSIATASNYTAKNLAYENVPDGNIYFRDGNNNVKGLWLNGSNVWEIVNMPTTVGCKGDMLYDNSMQRVYFRGTDNYIHCTEWNNASSSWVYDAMVSTNGQISAENSLAHIQGTDNIVFKGATDKVYSTTKQPNGTWHTDWLEGTYSSVAGDLLMDWTHVWFIAQSKQLCNYVYTNSPVWSVSPLNSSAPANTIGCSSFYRLANPQAENISSSELSVFPNPSNGTFQMNYASAVENVQAELFNLLGERLDNFSFSGTSYNYSPETNLAPGVYLLRVTNGGTITTTQLMIQ